MLSVERTLLLYLPVTYREGVVLSGAGLQLGSEGLLFGQSIPLPPFMQDGLLHLQSQRVIQSLYLNQLPSVFLLQLFDPLLAGQEQLTQPVNL